jgi:hypothetical protein
MKECKDYKNKWKKIDNLLKNNISTNKNKYLKLWLKINLEKIFL